MDIIESAPPRIILLGASNLTRGMSCALGALRRVLEVPYGSTIDVMIAAGHGRSYGMRSRVLGRALPGINECLLWNDLRERTPASRTFALITDIGNDIMYGASVDDIMAWVEWCAEQLQAAQARIVITAPPMASLRTLGPRRFAVVKALLFPTREVTFTQAMQRAEALANGVRELARRCALTLVESQAGWYGFDPIHIRMNRSAEAWAWILRHWIDASPANPVPLNLQPAPSWPRWWRLRTTPPRHFWWMGREFACAQPARHMPDGSIISLY